MRRPVLHFRNDGKFGRCGSSEKKKKEGDVGHGGYEKVSSFVFGDLMYVVPKVESGVTKRGVHLPAGGQVQLWMSALKRPERFPCPLAHTSYINTFQTDAQVAGPHRRFIEDLK